MMVQQRRFTRSAVSAGTARAAAAAFAIPAFVGAGGMMLAALPATPAQAQATGADLRVLSPRAGDTLGTSNFSLDVSFQSRSKSPVMTAELWVDGVRWVRRDLDAPQMKNVLSFAVDASTLSEGTHAVVVKVFCANGAVSSTQVNIQAGTNTGVSEGSFSGPQIKFLAPGNGKRVAGTLDISLDAPAKNGINPYVTFYVDKQFKTLKNYPPYTYAWDTTAVANGYHTIEAMGYLDTVNASTTRKVTVYVDNAGGATDIKSDIPDLNEARKQAPTTSAARTAAAPLVLPLPKSVVAAKNGGLVAPLTAPAFATITTGTPTETVSALGLSPVHPTYRRNVSDVRTATPKSAAPKPSAIGLDVRAAGLASFSPSLQGLTAAQAGLVSATPAAPAFRAAKVLHGAAPRFASAPPTRFAPLVPSAAPRKTTHTAPRAFVNPTALADTITRLSSQRSTGKTFQVAFDGQQIAFDVQPRVEAGLPLAPFRQIFEHTGGQVMWVPETRMVRAINADREIVIAVGRKQAHVNGQLISLQKPAFIERGRTIVPLSFVGKALDVDVKYDPATGHLQITSK